MVNIMIKLLIVDDSVFIRTTLEKILSSDDIKVIGKAKNGKEAVEMNKNLKPDVITMDIEMPVMTGIEAVQKIMSENPVPILMVSTLTQEGAEATMTALQSGALDFVTKSAAFTELHGLKDELIHKIKSIAGKKPRRRYYTKTSKIKSITESSLPKTSYNKSHFLKRDSVRPKSSDIEIVSIGISTGGPVALQEVIPNLSKDIPVSIIVAQHMPPYFTGTLANRLDNISQINVKEAENGEYLKRGTVYIAPGGKQLKVNRRNKVIIADEPEDALYKPSVDVMMDSVIRSFMNKSIGIMMTGMGRDGTQTFCKLKQMGGHIITQDEESSVVYGMPKSVVEKCGADEIVPLHFMADTINDLFNLRG